MTYRERAEELAAVLRSLPDAGVVHARSRNTPLWGRFVEIFKAPGGVINGWQLTRRRGELDAPRWAETYLLTKIRGMHDASESEFDFQEDLDAAVVAFRDGELTFGTVVGGLRIAGVEERLFGEAVCHVAECELVVNLYYSDL